jgi:PAS domain-containing protein
MEKELQNIPDLAAKSRPVAPADGKVSAALSEEAQLYPLFFELADFLIWTPTQEPKEWADVLLSKLMYACAANKAALHLVYATDEAKTPLLLTPLSVYGAARPNPPAIWLTNEPSPYSHVVKLKKTFYQTFDQVNSYLETAVVSLKNNALYIAPLSFNQNVAGVLELTALAPFPPPVLRLLERLGPLIGRQLEGMRYFFRGRLSFYETQAIKFIQGAAPFDDYLRTLTEYATAVPEAAWSEEKFPLSQKYRITRPFLIELDSAGRVANANPNFLQYLGEAPVDWVGTPVSKFIQGGGDWGPDFWQNLLKGQIWRGNLPFLSRRGGEKTLTAWLARHPAPLGGVAFLLTAFENNPAAQAEKSGEQTQAANEVERWYAAAAEKANLGFWRYDLRTHEVCWSDPMFKNFGVTPGKVPTLNQMLERIPLQDSGLFFNTIFVNAIAFEQPFEIEHSVILPEGRIRYLRTQGAPVFDENGIPYMLVGSSQDITAYRERWQEQENALQQLHSLYKAAQTHIARLEAALQSMLDLSQDFVLIYDRRLNLSYLNARLRRFLEERLQEPLPEPLPELCHFTTLLEKLNLLSPSEIESIAQNLRKSLGGESLNYSFHFQKPPHNLVLKAYQSPVFDPEGNVTKVIAMIQRNALLEPVEPVEPVEPEPAPAAMPAAEQRARLTPQGNYEASLALLPGIWQRACYAGFLSSYFPFLQNAIGAAAERFATLYRELPVLFSQLSWQHRKSFTLCLEAILQIRALPPLPNAYNSEELEATYFAQLATTALAEPAAAAKKLIALGFCFDLAPYLELFSLRQAESIFQCVAQLGQMQRSALLALGALQQLRLQAKEASFEEEEEMPGAAPTVFDFAQLIHNLLTEDFPLSEKKYIRWEYPTEPAAAYTLCAAYPLLRHSLKKLLSWLLSRVMPSAALTLKLSSSPEALRLSFYAEPSLPPLNLQPYPAALETINFDWRPALHFCLFLLKRLQITPYTPYTEPKAQEPPLLSLLIPRNLPRGLR